jgi:Zn-dependent protease with chaperone function
MAWLSVALTLAAYALASVLGGLAVAALSGPVARLGVSSTRRARLLLALRLLPSAAGLVVSLGMVLPAFLWLQPHQSDEEVGGALAMLALTGLALMAAGFARGVAAWRATRRLHADWMARGQDTVLPDVAWTGSRVVEDPFPIVAVIGIRRPRLVVAGQVQAVLTGAEWRAVVAHERAHVRSFDNLKSLALRFCPDLLAFLPAGHRLDQAWSAAVEDAADDVVAAHGRAHALHLASALVKVGRLAPQGIGPLPVIGLTDGRLTERVQRLLEPRTDASVAPAEMLGWSLVGILGMLGLTALTAGPALLQAIYETVERGLLLP